MGKYLNMIRRQDDQDPRPHETQEREPAPSGFDWWRAWQQLTNLAGTLELGDPRFPALMQAFDRCDEAFARGDVAGFTGAARQVETILTEPTPQGRQASPEPPLQAGWTISYRDQRNRLQDGTVSRCDRTEGTWTVLLTNGTAIPLRWVTSVKKVDAEGKVIAAWDTRAHGYDGERSRHG